MTVEETRELLEQFKIVVQNCLNSQTCEKDMHKQLRGLCKNKEAQMLYLGFVCGMSWYSQLCEQKYLEQINLGQNN